MSDYGVIPLSVEAFAGVTEEFDSDQTIIKLLLGGSRHNGFGIHNPDINPGWFLIMYEENGNDPYEMLKKIFPRSTVVIGKAN